ncbi:gfo/Idh/MocA family oxidoreductase [Paenibacillus psychroresistens]|uniref:Gfo/Idh/MocA family oxidoreductase n=1 Tax=Paenibacillus psychroresistens TaxID=1778678 RepID=A0A6B8RM68_9BACL|nr:Gfo/Idh/MocA family oxidoreductase [Paenibacillus psychroresistens]QGQ97491.1 gfo/Idh/MocA family oxidoreductase [Paenibacillus psychroresistens]
MTVQVGIIGTGWFSKVHAEILTNMEGVKLQAVCGTSQEKAAALAAEFNIPTSFDNVKDMLDAGKLDAVYILVPPMSHGDMELQLIERGIPFFIEKPIGLDVATPNQILNEIRKKSLITSVGYHFRYTEPIQHMLQQLKDQEIGMITGQWMGSMPQVAWWRDQARSGGQFIEQTTHLVDVLRYCIGEIDEVYAAFASRSMHKQYEGVTVADVGAVTLKFKNGAVANVSNTCILPDGINKVGLTVFTQAGTMDWDMERLEIVEVSGKSEVKKTLDAYKLENEAFIHAVRTGDTSRILSNYEDGLKTQQVTYAALESANSGLPVKL